MYEIVVNHHMGDEVVLIKVCTFFVMTSGIIGNSYRIVCGESIGS
jgi:hypothetical protein